MAEELGESLTKDTAAPPKKRSLFKKPLWTNPPEDEEEQEGVSFFSRAKDLYPMRVAEEERKRQRKLKKLERKRSTASAERQASKTPEVNKRQRVSSPADSHFSDTSPDNNVVHKPSSNRKPYSRSSPDSRRSASLQPKLQASPTSPSERYSREFHAKGNTIQKAPPNTGIVSLLSDSEGDDDGAALAVNNFSSVQTINIDDEDDVFPTPIADEDESPISDEEFPELVQKAREREEKKALERLHAEKASEDRNHDNPIHIDDIFDETVTAVDPVVDILITSGIEGTNPMIFRRKISQPLKPVREGWVTRQIQNPDLRSFVFLTWRGKKVYDVATCAFLGLKAGKDGKLTSVGNTLDEDGKLHLEAWTAPLFDAHQKKLERGADQEEVEQEEEPVEMTKLTLKSRNLEPVMVRVKPTTPIQKLVDCFRRTHNIGEEVDIALFFDGEKLSTSLNVGDTELGDRDNVDVHIR